MNPATGAGGGGGSPDVQVKERPMENPVSTPTTPSEAAFALLRRSSLPELSKVRALFEEAYQQAPGDYHPVDVLRVRGDDWQILRFLQGATSPADAFNALNGTLRWKKTAAVHDHRDEDFPREFYELNGTEILGRNAAGQLVCWITSRYSRSFTAFKEAMRAFVVHEIEHMDVLAGPAGMQVVSDARHTGLFSVDIELTRFMQDIVTRHYPGSIRQTLITNLSLLLDPIYKLVVAFLDPQLRATLKVVSSKNLAKFLELKYVPVAYGGTRVTRVVRLPAGAPSYTAMPSIKLTEEQKVAFKVLFKNLGIAVGDK